MTTAVKPRFADYIEDGVSTEFAAKFRFNKPSDVKAQRTFADGTRQVLAYGTDYSVTGGSTDDGGPLTVTAPAVAGTKLTLWCETTRGQGADYPTLGTFPSKSHETALDRLDLVDQEQDEKIALAPQVPRGQVAPSLDMTDIGDGDILQYSGGVLRRLVSAPFAGKFYAGDAVGRLVPSTGTGGGDEALRGDLASALSGALLIAWKAGGLGAVARTLFAKIADLPLNARDYGAKFDGETTATDDTAALQAAIDAAHAAHLDLDLPRGSALISAPLDLKGRELNIRGAGPSACAIQAIADMEAVFDIYETSDQPNLRVGLSGFTINGSDESGFRANYGIKARYRHHTGFASLLIINCRTALFRRDTWNCVDRDIRAIACEVGLNYDGANHSSSAIKCGASGCTSAAAIVNINSTAGDGNFAIKFDSCNLDFNSGKALVNYGNLELANCYIGENAENVVIENHGHAVVRGGAVYLGHIANASEIRPLGGSLEFVNTAINGQGAETLRSLARLLSNEIAAVGTVSYTRCIGSMNTNPIELEGDPFGLVPGKTYAKTHGRCFTKSTFGGADADFVPDGDDIVITVTNAGSGGAISAYVALDDGWSRAGAVFFMPTYQADMGVVAKLSNGALGSGYVLRTLSPNANIQTVPVLNSVPDAATYTVLEFVIPTLVVGQKLRIRRAVLGDIVGQNRRGAGLGTLGVMQ